MQPFFSIVTPSFNSSDTISDTLQSITTQSFKDYECIIVDGLSNDNTLELITGYSKEIKIISESDCGIYDAMNKGINASSGEWIIILNSDDCFADQTVLEKLAKNIKTDTTSEIFFSNIEYINQFGKPIRRSWTSKKFKPGAFLRGFVPPHPSFVVKKSVYEKYGLFNLEYEYAADFELMHRFLEIFKVRSSYLNLFFTKMRIGGKTSASFSNILKGNLEIISIMKDCYKRVPISFIFRRLFFKIGQYL